MTPEQAAGVIEGVLSEHPEVDARPATGERRWVAVLHGDVRQAIPVAIEVGQRSCVFSCFLMRGPRTASGAAALHELLLRRNLATHRLRFCLDADGDVVLLARLPLAAVDPEEVEGVLAELLTVADQSFEPLVRVGYPGVFGPLRPPTGPQ